MTGYRPMTLTNLAGRLTRTPEGKVRWKLMWEFLEEYRWEPAGIQLTLLDDEPPPTGTNAGTRYWRRWLSTWPPGTAPPRRHGRSNGYCAGRGSPPNWRSSGPRRWYGC